MNKPQLKHPAQIAVTGHDEAQSAAPARTLPASLICLLLVIAVHAGALGVMFYSASPLPKAIQLPTVQGILIPAPPAETVQLPSAQDIPPPVEPPPPEPEKPKPEPKKPKPKPEPKPKPIVEAPPSEKAITQEEQPVEESAPPPREAQQVATTKTDENTLGAPVTPPQEDANHLNNPRPAYPSLSRRLREQGTVILEVLIKTDGSVGEVRIKESSGFKRLDETAMKAVKQWSYSPARRGNEAIEYWYLQPIEFALH